MLLRVIETELSINTFSFIYDSMDVPHLYLQQK